MLAPESVQVEQGLLATWIGLTSVMSLVPPRGRRARLVEGALQTRGTLFGVQRSDLRQLRKDIAFIDPKQHSAPRVLTVQS